MLPMYIYYLYMMFLNKVEEIFQINEEFLPQFIDTYVVLFLLRTTVN